MREHVQPFCFIGLESLDFQTQLSMLSWAVVVSDQDSIRGSC
jgi:hypothetical protein